MISPAPAKPVKPARARRRSLLRRRPVQVALLFVVVLAAIHLVFSGGGTHAANAHVSAGSKRARPAHCRHACTARASRAGSAAPAKRHVKRRPPPLTPTQRYASGLLPVLDRSSIVFQQATYAASGGFDAVDSGCNAYGNRVSILADRADGIPHPGAWYGAVAGLHRQVLAVYHTMEGVLVNCIDAAESGDGGGIAQAQRDMRSAASQMRHLDRWMHRMARRRA